jgi:hypothetical protein
MTAADRVIRIIIAVIFAVLYFTGTVTSPVGIILLIIGIVFVLTGASGFCPIYLALGIGKKAQ